MYVAEVVEAVEAVRRIPKPQRLGVTFYSEADTWHFQSVFDGRRCELCSHYERAETWRGDQLRLEFPYHEIHDESTIKANIHPNCRCYLVRRIG